MKSSKRISSCRTKPRDGSLPVACRSTAAPASVRTAGALTARWRNALQHSADASPSSVVQRAATGSSGPRSACIAIAAGLSLRLASSACPSAIAAHAATLIPSVAASPTSAARGMACPHPSTSAPTPAELGRTSAGPRTAESRAHSPAHSRPALVAALRSGMRCAAASSRVSAASTDLQATPAPSTETFAVEAVSSAANLAAVQAASATQPAACPHVILPG